MAYSVSQSDAVNWVSGWKLELSGSVCIPIDVFSIALDRFELGVVHSKSICPDELLGRYDDDDGLLKTGLESSGHAVTTPKGAFIRQFKS